MKKKYFRWIARILGTIIAVLWLLMGLGYAVGDEEPFTWESAVISVLVIALTVGVITAWFKEKIGGIILVTAGTVMCFFALITAGSNQLLAMLTSGFPFILVGILFLLAWQKTTKK